MSMQIQQENEKKNDQTQQATCALLYTYMLMI